MLSNSAMWSWFSVPETTCCRSFHRFPQVYALFGHSPKGGTEASEECRRCPSTQPDTTDKLWILYGKGKEPALDLPQTQRHWSFLSRALLVKWTPNQNTKQSPGFGSWMSLQGDTATSPLSPTAKTGWYSATASPLCPDRPLCPPHVAALDNPQNILAIPSEKLSHKKGPPHSHPANSSGDFSRMKRNHRVSYKVFHEGLASLSCYRSI